MSNYWGRPGIRELSRKAGVLFDYVLRGTAFLACLVLAFAWLSVVFEIGMRGFLNRPQAWVLDYSSYSLLYLTLLGAAWLLKREKHVILDIVINQFNEKTRTLLNIVTSILCAVTCLFITWYGTKATWMLFQSGLYFFTEMRTLQWIVYCVIPVGSFLLFIQFLRRAYGHCERLRVTSDEQKEG